MDIWSWFREKMWKRTSAVLFHRKDWHFIINQVILIADYTNWIYICRFWPKRSKRNTVQIRSSHFYCNVDKGTICHWIRMICIAHILCISFGVWEGVPAGSEARIFWISKTLLRWGRSIFASMNSRGLMLCAILEQETALSPAVFCYLGMVTRGHR